MFLVCAGFVLVLRIVALVRSYEMVPLLYPTSLWFGFQLPIRVVVYLEGQKYLPLVKSIYLWVYAGMFRHCLLSLECCWYVLVPF